MMVHSVPSPTSIPLSTRMVPSPVSKVRHPEAERQLVGDLGSASLPVTNRQANLNELASVDSPRSERSGSAKTLREQVGTVLVIDDSDIARASMVNVLAEAGLNVVALASPIGATRAILDHKVAVAVVDILMPGMRGDRLATLFRSNPRFKNVAVVLVSGESGVELDRLLTDTGADAAVSKLDLQYLLPAVIRARRKRMMNGA
jgi:PleD family two-component response regulator